MHPQYKNDDVNVILVQSHFDRNLLNKAVVNDAGADRQYLVEERHKIEAMYKAAAV